MCASSMTSRDKLLYHQLEGRKPGIQIKRVHGPSLNHAYDASRCVVPSVASIYWVESQILHGQE